jgi:hypothetical protein
MREAALGYITTHALPMATSLRLANCLEFLFTQRLLDRLCLEVPFQELVYQYHMKMHCLPVF